jgi:hypothetical protein
MIVRLYTLDSEGRHDHDLADDVAGRLLAALPGRPATSPTARSSAPSCGRTFGRRGSASRAGRVGMPRLRLSVTADEYPRERGAHANLNGRGRPGGVQRVRGALPAPEDVQGEAALRSTGSSMPCTGTGNLAARNLFEGRAKHVLAQLEPLAGRESLAIGAALRGALELREPPLEVGRPRRGGRASRRKRVRSRRLDPLPCGSPVPSRIASAPRSQLLGIVVDGPAPRGPGRAPSGSSPASACPARPTVSRDSSAYRSAVETLPCSSRTWASIRCVSSTSVPGRSPSGSSIRILSRSQPLRFT